MKKSESDTLLVILMALVSLVLKKEEK